MKIGIAKISTQATGWAMTKVRNRNNTANGKSQTISAAAPESVLRTISTSRNSACQYAAGRASSADNGSREKLIEEAAPNRNVQPQRYPLHNARPRLPKHPIERQNAEDADDQALQGSQPGMEDDAIVDLHDEDRHGERQQVYEEGQRQFRRKSAKAA